MPIRRNLRKVLSKIGLGDKPASSSSTENHSVASTATPLDSRGYLRPQNPTVGGETSPARAPRYASEHAPVNYNDGNLASRERSSVPFDPSLAIPHNKTTSRELPRTPARIDEEDTRRIPPTASKDFTKQSGGKNTPTSRDNPFHDKETYASYAGNPRDKDVDSKASIREIVGQPGTVKPISRTENDRSQIPLGTPTSTAETSTSPSVQKIDIPTARMRILQEQPEFRGKKLPGTLTAEYIPIVTTSARFRSVEKVPDKYSYTGPGSRFDEPGINKATTDVETVYSEPVIHTTVRPTEKHTITEKIETHHNYHHVQPIIQPITEKTILPTAHYLQTPARDMVEISKDEAEKYGPPIWVGERMVV